MENNESFREVSKLRLRFQMNNRLRLESLAALSKVFREFGEPLSDDLLSSLIFALPQELSVSNGHGFVKQAAAPPSEESYDSPGGPPQEPGGPPQEPGGPPQEPGGPPQEPGGPPQEPGGPPQEPGGPPQEPGGPPQAPKSVSYLEMGRQYSA
jgi:hypothetical protein